MREFDYREKFKKSAHAYDELTQSKHISLIYELEQAVLLELFAGMNSSGKTVMDFACGTGRWTRFLEEHFMQVTGVDVSEDMLNLARQKCSKAEFICTDITSDKPGERLVGRKFDVITAFRFYKNAQPDLRKAATASLPKYLKEKGLFIFDLHLNTFSIMGLFANLIRILNLHKIFRLGDLMVRTISLRDIQRLFRNSPFEIVDYYGMGLLPGRSNFTILPRKLLYEFERFLAKKKLFRGYSYNILVVAARK